MAVRWFPSLDAYRGLAVFLMLFFNFVPLLCYGTSFLLLHNQGNTLLPGDLIAPMFQFMVGIALAISIEKRQQEHLSWDKAAIRITRRFAFILLLGMILDAVTYTSIVTWGVLETIGVAGIIAYLLKDYSDGEIVLISLVMLSAYGVASTQEGFVWLLNALPHGGPLGAISFAVITIAGMVLGRHLIAGSEDITRNLFVTSIVLMVMGLVASSVMPFNKQLVSPSYVVFATGTSALFFAILYWLFEEKKFSFTPLTDMGREALTAWTLQFILVFWPLYFIFKITNFLAFWSGIAATLFLMLIFYLICEFLNRRGMKMAL